MHCWRLNSGPHTCKASILPTELMSLGAWGKILSPVFKRKRAGLERGINLPSNERFQGWTLGLLTPIPELSKDSRVGPWSSGPQPRALHLSSSLGSWTDRCISSTYTQATNISFLSSESGSERWLRCCCLSGAQQALGGHRMGNMEFGAGLGWGGYVLAPSWVPRSG